MNQKFALNQSVWVLVCENPKQMPIKGANIAEIGEGEKEIVYYFGDGINVAEKEVFTTLLELCNYFTAKKKREMGEYITEMNVLVLCKYTFRFLEKVIRKKFLNIDVAHLLEENNHSFSDFLTDRNDIASVEDIRNFIAFCIRNSNNDNIREFKNVLLYVLKDIDSSFEPKDEYIEKVHNFLNRLSKETAGFLKFCGYDYCENLFESEFVNK